MDYNFYIDFLGMFYGLLNRHKSELVNNKHKSEHYKLIGEFFQKNCFDFECMPEECEFNEQNIIFCFGYDFNDANESNNQSTTADVTIVYDRMNEEFISYDYKQG